MARMGDGHSFAMKKFNLELHPEKTRLLEFGPHAIDQRQWRGEVQPVRIPWKMRCQAPEKSKPSYPSQRS